MPLRARPIGIFLFIATLAIFCRVLAADFVQWDDDVSVYENPHIQGLDWNHLRWMFTDASYAMRYKPLTWLLYALIHHFCGLNPFGYHLVNLTLHGFNAVLLFLVIRRLLAAYNSADATGEALDAYNFPAAGGALLWAMNPLRVEPVARVTDVTYGLMLFFLLISLIAYLRAQQPAKTDHGRRWFLAGSVAAYAAAMLVYPFAAGWAFVLAVLDWQPLRRYAGCKYSWRDPQLQKIWLEKIPFLLLGGLALTTFVARLNPTGFWAGQAEREHLSPFVQGMQACYVWVYYAWKPWVPFHLTPLYTKLVDFKPATWPFVLSAAMVVAATAVLLWKRRQWPWALALWLCHLVLLLPALGLTEHPHFTSDRYAYLAGVVAAVGVAAALWQARHHPVLASIIVLIMTAWWGTLSYRQTGVWKNSATLFHHMLQGLENNSYRETIHFRLGSYYASRQKFELAAQQYQAALQIRHSRTVHDAFGQLLETAGHPDGALTNYLESLKVQADATTHVKVAILSRDLGRKNDAIKHYRAALVLDTNLVSALNNLAWILATDTDANLRDGAEAVLLAQRAAALTDQQNPIALRTLAAAFAEAGNFEKAVETARAAAGVASGTDNRGLADHIAHLLQQFQAGQAWRDSARQ